MAESVSAVVLLQFPASEMKEVVVQKEALAGPYLYAAGRVLPDGDMTP